MELLKAFQHRLIDATVTHPWWSLGSLLAVSGALALQMPMLRGESDMLSFVPRGDPAYRETLALEETFGSTQLSRIIITRDDHPDGVFNPETLALVAEITDWLKTRSEYETERNSDLRSISTVNNIRADESGMIVEPFMAVPPKDRASALAVRDALAANSAYAGVLASKDGRALSILVREAAAVGHNRGRNVFDLLAYLDSFRARGHTEGLYATGRPVIEGLFTAYIPEETRRMGPFVITMLCVFLFTSFRTLRAVVTPLAVIVCTEAWMLGFLALWGHPVYTVTSILPVLIMAIAVADAIHLLSQYYETQVRMPDADKTTVVRHTMAQMNTPVLMTSATTAVGFLTMRMSAIEPLADFGLIASVGIGSAYVITVIGIPAVLMLLPLQRPHWRNGIGEGQGNGTLDAFLRKSVSTALRPAATIISFALLLGLATNGMFLLTIDSSQVGQFRPGHFLRTVDEIDNTRFSGSTVLDIVIDGLDNDRLKDPDVLRRIDTLQARIEEMDVVGDTFSIAELVKRMNRVMNEDRPEAEIVPATAELVAQYLLLYSISGDPGDFDDIVDYDYRRAHVMVFIRDSGTAASRAVVARAEELGQEIFPADAGAPRFILSGPALVRAHLEGYIASSQIATLLVCLPVLFLLMWAQFRSARVGLLCIMPVSLAVCAIYGLMGYVGVPTDIGTTMLGGMTLGIGIDFAIHYTHRYRRCREEGLEPKPAAEQTAATAGRAIFYNASVLLGGFMVLVLARLYPQVKLGLLVSATMIISLLATMLLFPAVFVLTPSFGDPSSRSSRDEK